MFVCGVCRKIAPDKNCLHNLQIPDYIQLVYICMDLCTYMYMWLDCIQLFTTNGVEITYGVEN